MLLYSRKVYETVGEYDPEMTLVEDYDYWQRICAQYEPACIPQKLYAYRWHDGALTSTMRKDTFNTTLERCLLKNHKNFGKIDVISKYYYYYGLHRCRVNLANGNNPYRKKYLFYYALYTLIVRAPNKLRRMFSGNI